MIKKNLCNQLKATFVVKATPQAFDVNETRDAFLNFNAVTALTAVSISEKNGASTATVVPVERLVFNPADIEAGRVVVNSLLNSFSVTIGSCVNVGYYTSAQHDQIQASENFTLFVDGYRDFNN